MKKLCSIALCAATSAFAQGTFQFDQQSSTDETPVLGVSGAGFQQEQPFGQSFTPTLNSIGFIRLNVADSNPGNSLGATVYVNLRTSSITGPVLGSTTPVVLPDAFAGVVNFLFPAALDLVPGTEYYMQPVVQTGDLWTSATAGDFIYPGGELYHYGAVVPGASLWFREGLYTVPEPSGFMLVLLGLGGVAVRLR